MSWYPFFWGRIEYVHEEALRVAYFVALIEQLDSGSSAVSVFRFDTQENALRCVAGANDSGDGLKETITRPFWFYETHDSLDSYNRCELVQAITDCAHACNCLIDHVVGNVLWDDPNAVVTMTPTMQGVKRLVDNW